MLEWIKRLGRTIVRISRDFKVEFLRTLREQFKWTFLKSVWSKLAIGILMLPVAIALVLWQVGIAAAVASGLVDIFIVEPIRRMLNLGPVLNVCLSVTAFVAMWFLMVNIAEVTAVLVTIGLVMELDAILAAATAGIAYFKQQWASSDATN